MKCFPEGTAGVIKDGLLIILAAAMLPASCRKDPYRREFPDKALEIEIKRLENDLFSLELDSIPSRIGFFYEKYGDFFDLYNSRIINIGTAGQSTYPRYLNIFLTDRLNNQVYQETMKVFPDLSSLEEQLGTAFGHYRHFFPARQIPAVYTFISRFNQSIVVSDSILAIGLDKYLGWDCPYYPQLGLHSYLIKNMHPGKILSDCVCSWCLTEFIYNDSVDNVLSNMIHQGKIWYLTKSVLPDHPDHLIAGFTEQEMEFCRANEAKMWEYLIERDILFLSDRFSIRKYCGNGPFTRDFGSDSPAMAAVWIGWRIVEGYATENPDQGMEQIMEEDDFHRILALSGYNP